MPSPRVTELLLQALAHERGVVVVYRIAIECAVHPELRAEWARFHDESQHHVVILTDVCESLGIDPRRATCGCKVVQQVGTSLTVAMQMAIASDDPSAAELVACDCVVLAETKDHANWELLAELAESLDGEPARLLLDAVNLVEAEEDVHLHRNRRWCRELWLDALGLPAVLPPREEREHVRTAPEPAKVEKARRRHEESASRGF